MKTYYTENSRTGIRVNSPDINHNVKMIFLEVRRYSHPT